MRIIANDYEPKMVMKILREWTELKQPEFGKSIGLSGMTIQGYERGIRRYTFETLLHIADVHGLTITIEKKNSINVGTNRMIIGNKDKGRDKVND